MSGNYSIGPTGNFISISSAILALKTNGLANNVVLELQNGYVGSAETYPIVFPAIPCQNNFSIILRPAPGASGLILSTNISSQTLVLDSIQNLTIDGRPGGIGSAKELTIQNTAANGIAININNDASSNILQYLFLKAHQLLQQTASLLLILLHLLQETIIIESGIVILEIRQHFHQIFYMLPVLQEKKIIIMRLQIIIF